MKEKKLLRIADYWPEMEAYLGELPTVKLEQKWIAEELVNSGKWQFNAQNLAKHALVKQYIATCKGVDQLNEADEMPERGKHAYNQKEAPKGKPDYSWKETSETAEVRFVADAKRITTFDDAVAASGADLSIWEADKWEYNKWEMGFKKNIHEVTRKVGEETHKDTEVESGVQDLIQVFVSFRRKKAAVVDVEKLRAENIAYMQQYAPVYHTIKREALTDGHLLILDPADTHFGKYAVAEETGEPYNLSLAESRTKEGVAGILQKAAGFPVDKIALFLGNDILHTENGKTTTKGTPQDMEGMWYEAYQVAKRTMIEIIEGVLLKADVHLVFNPSNHDYRIGYMLFDTIATHFHKAKNVTVDGSMAHYKYMMYGNSLIGTSHGDGVKMSKLAEVMAYEAKARWADALFYHFYTAHQHHMKALDIMGVSVEGVRSISAPDSYHAKNAYKGPMSMTAFIHSKEFGQATRITHNFKPYAPQGMPVFELTPEKLTA